MLLITGMWLAVAFDPSVFAERRDLISLDHYLYSVQLLFYIIVIQDQSFWFFWMDIFLMSPWEQYMYFRKKCKFSYSGIQMNEKNIAVCNTICTYHTSCVLKPYPYCLRKPYLGAEFWRFFFKISFEWVRVMYCRLEACKTERK